MSKTTDNIQSKKIGLIKWFGNKKTNGKYGFIVDIANIEYFFNNQCLSKKTTLDKSFSIEKDLVQDRIVFFEAKKRPKGDIAENIVLLEHEDDINLLFKFYIDLKLTRKLKHSCFITLEKKLKELFNIVSTETYNQLLNNFKDFFHEKTQKPDNNYATKKYLKDVILNFFQNNINDLEFDGVFSSRDKILLYLKDFDIKFSVSDYKHWKYMLTSEQINKLIDKICSNKNYTLENLLDIFDFNVLEISNQIYILETFKKYSIDYKKISNFISKENSFLLSKYFDIEFDICSYKEYVFSTGDKNNIKNFISELCSCNKFNIDDLCKILDINNIDFEYQKCVFDIIQNKVDFNKILEFITLDKAIIYLWLKYPKLEIQFNRKFIEFINDFTVEEQSFFIKKIFLEISKNKTTTDIFNNIKSNYDSIVLVLYIIKDILDRYSKTEKINRQNILQKFLGYLLEKYREKTDIDINYLKKSIENINFFDKCYGVYDLEESLNKHNALIYKVATSPAHIEVLNRFHYFCDGQKEPTDWLERTIDHYKKRKYPEYKYRKYLYIDKEIKDRWKCSTHCYKPARLNLESFNLVKCFKLINISVSDEEYCIYSGILNKIRIYIPHLVCNKCGRILQFNTKNNYAAERITHFICNNCSTGNSNDDIYISHCSNFNCFNVIDSRYSHRCKIEENSNIGIGLFVCNYCLDCCHKDQVSMYNNKNLREGHREHGIICCPKCGEHLITYDNYYNAWNQYLQTLRNGTTQYGDQYFIVPKNNKFIDKKIIVEIFGNHEYSEDCYTKEKLEELLSGTIINSNSYPDNFLFIQKNKNKNIFLVCENPECLNIIEYDQNDKYARTNTIKMRHHLFFTKNEKSN